MILDLFKEEREKAEVLPCGLKVLKGNTVKGKPYFKIWKPKAIKPSANYYFNLIEESEKYLQYQIDNFVAYKKRKEEYKQARKGTAEDLKKVQIGSIFHHSWGYEQTNCDFYQVVKKTGRMVEIREIAQTITRADGSMSNFKKPVKDKFLKPHFEGDKQGEILKKKIQFSSGEPYLSFEYVWCSLWDGKEKYCSWYA